jgi:hypothetical protein
MGVKQRTVARVDRGEQVSEIMEERIAKKLAAKEKKVWKIVHLAFTLLPSSRKPSPAGPYMQRHACSKKRAKGSYTHGRRTRVCPWSILSVRSHRNRRGCQAPIDDYAVGFLACLPMERSGSNSVCQRSTSSSCACGHPPRLSDPRVLALPGAMSCAH